jgi:hypothetical protein
MDIFAAINIDPVTVRVDFQAVDGQIIDAGEQQGEMAAGQHGKIAKRNIAAVFQRHCFISCTGALRVRQFALLAAAQTFAPDESGTEDADVM